MIMTPTNSVVVLVRIVKRMRELRCELFLGEPNAKITSKWLRIVEDTLDQMQFIEGLRMSCAAHLLSNRARS